MAHTGRSDWFNLPAMNDNDTASGDSFGDQNDGIDYTLQTHSDAWGDGIIGEDSWEVTADAGLSVNVAIGAGLLHKFGGLTEAIAAVTVTDDATSYVWAIISNDGVETDQAWAREPSFECKPAATGYQGLVLAEVTAAAGAVTLITDLRVRIGQAYLAEQDAAMAADIAWLAAALGVDYADFDPLGLLGTVDARLDDLEAAVSGIDPSASAPYWGALEKSAADDRTVEEWHEDLHDADDADKSGGVTRTDWDALTTSHLQALIRHVHLQGGSMVASQRNVYVFSARMSPDSAYDTVNSTATVNRVTGVIE
jgi:hypothetical protein